MSPSPSPSPRIFPKQLWSLPPFPYDDSYSSPLPPFPLGVKHYYSFTNMYRMMGNFIQRILLTTFIGIVIYHFRYQQNQNHSTSPSPSSLSFSSVYSLAETCGLLFIWNLVIIFLIQWKGQRKTRENGKETAPHTTSLSSLSLSFSSSLVTLTPSPIIFILIHVPFILFTLFLATPILHSLCSSYSTDTVDFLIIGILLINWISHRNLHFKPKYLVREREMEKKNETEMEKEKKNTEEKEEHFMDKRHSPSLSPSPSLLSFSSSSSSFPFQYEIISDVGVTSTISGILMTILNISRIQMKSFSSEIIKNQKDFYHQTNDQNELWNRLVPSLSLLPKVYFDTNTLTIFLCLVLSLLIFFPTPITFHILFYHFPTIHFLITNVIFMGLSYFAFFHLSFSSMLLTTHPWSMGYFILFILFVWFICPLLFVFFHRWKQPIRGDWDYDDENEFSRQNL